MKCAIINDSSGSWRKKKKPLTTEYTEYTEPPSPTRRYKKKSGQDHRVDGIITCIKLVNAKFLNPVDPVNPVQKTLADDVL